MPRQQGRSWGCVEAERERAGGKLAGRRAAVGASIIGPARNASSPQKEILRLRRDNKGLRFISNAEPAPRRPASHGQPTKDPFVHAGARPARSWDQGLMGGEWGETSHGKLGGRSGHEGRRKETGGRDRGSRDRTGLEGQRKGDFEGTGHGVSARGQSIMGSRDWGTDLRDPRALA